MPNADLQALLAGKKTQAPTVPAPTVAGPAAAAAAVVEQVTLPNAGTPQQNLLQLVTAFAARNGTTPKVNPPESQKVLETETTAEANGAPQPDEDDKGPPVEPPTSKPQDVIDKENEKRPRRTAAVVQEELDIANVEIEVLKKQLQAKSSSKQEDLDYITQLRGEATICEADKAKAWKRVEDLEGELATAEGMCVHAAELIAQLQTGVASAPTQGPTVLKADHLQCEELVAVLAGRGFKVTLEVLPA